MANKHIEGCTTLLVSMEVKIKITVRYCYMPIRMKERKNRKKKNHSAKCWQACEAMKALMH